MLVGAFSQHGAPAFARSFGAASVPRLSWAIYRNSTKGFQVRSLSAVDRC